MAATMAPAQDQPLTATRVTRADWSAYVAALHAAAERCQQPDPAVPPAAATAGYERARTYYDLILKLHPVDQRARAGGRLVDAQLARLQRQRRWRQVRSLAAQSLWGSDRIRGLNDGNTVGIGRMWLDVQASDPELEALIPQQLYMVTHRRCRVPVQLRVIAGGGVDGDGDVRAGASDLLAGVAAAELAYTVTPLPGFILPYIGAGYQVLIGYYDHEGGGGDYLVHGTALSAGVALSLGRHIKIGFDYGRSLEVYGSEHNAPVWRWGAGPAQCSDCHSGWSNLQLDAQLLF